MKFIGPRRPVVGRPAIWDRLEIQQKYGLTEKQAKSDLTPQFIKQLNNCADEEARRILLRVTPKTEGSKRTWRKGTRTLGVTREEYLNGC